MTDLSIFLFHATEPSRIIRWKPPYYVSFLPVFVLHLHLCVVKLPISFCKYCNKVLWDIFFNVSMKCKFTWLTNVTFSPFPVKFHLSMRCPKVTKIHLPALLKLINQHVILVFFNSYKNWSLKTTICHFIRDYVLDYFLVLVLGSC